MKSRISSSKFTALRKDITRFAPAWVLYIVASILGLMSVLNFYNNYSTPRDIATTIRLMPIANFGYALLVAQLLFGDLFNSRMCNAVHALPLKRSDWFTIHTASGLLFAFVPHLLFALMTLPFMGKVWTVSFWWMLAANLQYLFFFGVAVFCVFCTGSRFAMAVVYGLVNFLSMLAWWFADMLYQPLLYGLDLDFTIFQKLCPVVQMCSFEYLDIHRSSEPILPGSLQTTYKVWCEVVEGWDYLAICAAIGIILGAAGLLLYRKRNLETAGDFITVKFLEPVFLVLFSLAVGAVLQIIESIFMGTDGYLFLFVGIAIGFYLGRMLLLRTTRVFQPKSFFALASLVGLLLASIGFVGMDVLGIVGWVPEAEEVKSITVASGYYRYSDEIFYDHAFCADTPEDINIFLDVHQGLLEDWKNISDIESVPGGNVIIETETNREYRTRIDFVYEMKDGRTVHRYYSVSSKSDEAAVLKPYFSSVEAVLGQEAADPARYVSLIHDIYIRGGNEVFVDSTQIKGLVEAIIADCNDGTMAQEWSFHPSEESICHIEFTFHQDLDPYRGRWSHIQIFPSCENTIAWLKANGVELWEISEYD